MDIKFTRNTIDNLSEQADLANKVSNLISKESTIELLRDIIDPEQEKERVKTEKEANMAQFEQQIAKNEEPDEDVNEEEDNEQIQRD